MSDIYMQMQDDPNMPKTDDGAGAGDDSAAGEEKTGDEAAA